jgi:hypothetical protein
VKLFNSRWCFSGAYCANYPVADDADVPHLLCCMVRFYVFPRVLLLVLLQAATQEQLLQWVMEADANTKVRAAACLVSYACAFQLAAHGSGDNPASWQASARCSTVCSTTQHQQQQL